MPKRQVRKPNGRACASTLARLFGCDGVVRGEVYFSIVHTYEYYMVQHIYVYTYILLLLLLMCVEERREKTEEKKAV